MFNTGFSISVRCGDVSTTWSVEHMDCTLDELYNAFKGLLVSQGFTEECINKYLKELSDEIKD